MKFLASINFLFLSFGAFGNTEGFDSQQFSFFYKSLDAKAVCWQTCRDNRCEEAEWEIFWDLNTFFQIQAADRNGFRVHIEEGMECENESITQVTEHMPNLQKSSPKRVFEIINKQGTAVRVLIHSDINEVVSKFIESLNE